AVADERPGAGRLVEADQVAVGPDAVQHRLGLARGAHSATQHDGQASHGENQVQPAAKAFRKQEKSRTFSTGGSVELSQLAYESPAANLFRKHPKSFTLSAGGLAEQSQLA